MHKYKPIKSKAMSKDRERMLAKKQKNKKKRSKMNAKKKKH